MSVSTQIMPNVGRDVVGSVVGSAVVGGLVVGDRVGGIAVGDAVGIDMVGALVGVVGETVGVMVGGWVKTILKKFAISSHLHGSCSSGA